MRRVMVVMLTALVLTGAAPSAIGGWTVVTVEELPEFLIAGKPMPIAFTIRQHGREPMDGRSPAVTIRQSDASWLRGRTSMRVRPGRAAGRYEAILLARDTGMVEITIDSDWHDSRLTLLPIPVIASTVVTRRAPLNDYDRGRQLFVAKGCVTCHVKADDAELSGRRTINAGPELTGKRYAADWVVQKILNPERNRVRYNDYAVMPALEVSEKEAAALAAYINGAKEPAVVGTGQGL